MVERIERTVEPTGQGHTGAVSLTAGQVRALEAYADTVLPGRKRGPDDAAIAGVSSTPGAVEAGAIAVLTNPATGIEDGVAEMADLLDKLAGEHVGDPTMTMADLPYPQRRELLATLTGADRPDRDLWFLVALFAYMAYDSAPHRNTAAAMAERHPGLYAMGFREPDADGRWRVRIASYGKPLAPLHPSTDARGNLP